MKEIFTSNAFIGTLFAAIPAIVGWVIVHQLNMKRDRINKRRDMITEILLSAYRHLEMASNREYLTDEHVMAFESAFSDIQLLGNLSQVTAAKKYGLEHAESGEGNINELLLLLRDELRSELKLAPIREKPIIFRFKRGVKLEFDGNKHKIVRATQVNVSALPKDNASVCQS